MAALASALLARAVVQQRLGNWYATKFNGEAQAGMWAVHMRADVDRAHAILGRLRMEVARDD